MSLEQWPYPSMLNQAVYSNEVNNKVPWVEPSEYQLELWESEKNLTLLKDASRHSREELAQARREFKLGRRQLAAERLLVKAVSSIQRSAITIKDVAKKTSFSLQEAALNENVVGILSYSKAIATATGVGTSLRFALGAEQQFNNGNPDKAIIAAAIGAAALLAPITALWLSKEKPQKPNRLSL